MIAQPDLKDLMYAKSLLENPGLAARLANVIGTPIEKGFALLPANWSSVVQNAVRPPFFARWMSPSRPSNLRVKSDPPNSSTS